MSQHFEHLWEAAEKNHSSKLDESAESIINHLLLKINLYRSLVIQQPPPPEELDKVKSHLMGEVLLTLTHLSLKENIDVFKALQTALNFSDIEKFKAKYQSSP